MNPEDFIPYIRYSDIPEAYQPIVSMIGIEAFFRLCQLCGGAVVYLPITDSIIRTTRNRIIMQEYNGYNARLLSRKYGMTEKHIKNIVKGARASKNEDPGTE